MNTKQVVTFAIGVAVGVYVVPLVLARLGRSTTVPV